MIASMIAVASTITAAAAFNQGYAQNFQSSSSPSKPIASRDAPPASFNISAPAGYIAAAPAFDVVCHPIYIQQGWLDCDNVGAGQANSRVQSMWTDASESELIKISVAHIWTDEGGKRTNATGFAEIEAGTVAFNVPVTMLSAVL
ncbi:hypothetical protein PG994_000172 [Apiospora phragmitis]|uniref:Uncharacterized protein n=1 Tax=Apiospora phragmitis TaxID=2905665 RepID=A0ABR1X5L2_9PEZI